ncbi:unnamed protein product [Peronospora destructor]|uniref:Uncharacterized protein n=1 Tax=Peronospora destructor TaxID=86335 RepID=A0AAV0ULY6_9STRA|nr:unnamed protein product [Peronospora destructor]
MAFLAASTVATGGLMGIAGFFVWRKGLFRKRYAALFGDEVYNENKDLMSCDYQGDNAISLFGERGFGSKHKSSSRRIKSTSGGVVGKPEDPVVGPKVTHGSVAFRLFEFDPEKQQLVFSSVGRPVKFGTPLIVVHPETGRAIRYLTHRGAVTISKPPVNLAFHRQARASLFAMEEAAMRHNSRKRTMRQSLPAALVSSSTSGSNNNGNEEQREATEQKDHTLVPDIDHSDFMVDIADQSQNQGQTQRQVQVLTNYPRGRKLQNLSNVSSRRTQQHSASHHAVQCSASQLRHD